MGTHVLVNGKRKKIYAVKKILPLIALSEQIGYTHVQLVNRRCSWSSGQRWKLGGTGMRLLHWSMRRYGVAMGPCGNVLPTNELDAWKMSWIGSLHKPGKA
jgi:hypothetical protein